MNKHKKETFEAWVTRNGGEVLATIDEYEVARYKAFGKTMVVYTDKNRKRRTFSNGNAKSHYVQWEQGESMRLNERITDYKNGQIVAKSIMDRDGPRCFYCNEPFSDEVKPTIEHLVSRVHGGPDHMANKFLSCKDCNEEAGHLSAPEKIRLRDSKLWQ